jgi:predicted kinase
MTPINLLLLSLHLALLATAVGLTAMSFKLWRRGHLNQRLPLVIAAAQTALCTIIPAGMLLVGRINLLLLWANVTAVMVLTVVTWWVQRHAIAIMLVNPPPVVEPGELHITRGLPASGKSSEAKQWVAENPHARARLTRDELRRDMHGGWHRRPEEDALPEGCVMSTEDQVTIAQHAAALALLRHGVSVIIDDTNLEDRHVAALLRIAMAARSKVRFIDLRHVPLEVCQQRNAARSGDEHVPPEVIERMWCDHIAPLGLATKNL